MRGNLIVKGNLISKEVRFLIDENGMYECGTDGKIIPYQQYQQQMQGERKNSFERIIDGKLRTYHNTTNMEQDNFWTDEKVAELLKRDMVYYAPTPTFNQDEVAKNIIENFKKEKQSNQLNDLQKESIQKQIIDLKEKHDKRVEEANKYCDDALEKIKEAILNPTRQPIQHQEKQDKGYEITAFKDRIYEIVWRKYDDGNYYSKNNFGKFTYDFLVKNIGTAFEIESVKRISDGNEFTVDEVTEQGKIKKIVADNFCVAAMQDGTSVMLYELTKKKEKEVLFTTDAQKEFIDEVYKMTNLIFGKMFMAFGLFFMKDKDAADKIVNELYSKTRELTDKIEKENQ